MRTRSSRHSKGLVGWKIPLVAVLAALSVRLLATCLIVSYTAPIAFPSAVISEAMLLPGMGTPGWPGMWSWIGLGRASNALKSRLISALVGSVLTAGFANRRILFHSCPPKKKSLPRLMGPPKSQPKSLKRSGPLIAPGVGSLASNASFRMNSNIVPWKPSPPLRVTTFTEAPELRPYSAEKFDDFTATSRIKSMPTLLTWLLFDPESRLKPPSTDREFESLRLPLTD